MKKPVITQENGSAHFDAKLAEALRIAGLRKWNKEGAAARIGYPSAIPR